MTAGPPYAYYQPPPPQQSNPLGVTGFIISLCGLMCALGFPIGLIISLIGLRREPKGFAIAGTIIGALGTLGVVLVLAIYGAIIAAIFGFAVPIAETGNAIRDAETRIDEFEAENGRLPTETEGNDLIGDIQDGWENELRYEVQDGDYEIRSAGKDGVFDTGDDMTRVDAAFEGFEDLEDIEDSEEPEPVDPEEMDFEGGIDLEGGEDEVEPVGQTEPGD